MDIDKLTSIDQLRGDEGQLELAEVIGLDAYKKLVAHYGGGRVYVQKASSVLKEVRDLEIREKFNGWNYRSLAIEYRLSESTIRDIVAPKHKEDTMDEQLSFDDA